MEQVRIAVIGCGSIANSYHMPALQHVNGVIWRWACDLIEERAEKARQDYGFEKVTTDYREVLADPDVDAVFIFTKIDSHAEIAIASARAGKQIFMQKAIGYSLAEAQTILDTVRECEVQMTMSFMHRYFDETRKAKEIIESGVLGELQNIRVRNATKNPEHTAPSYGGCMMDIGGHGIDLVRSLCGQDIRRVLSLSVGGGGTGAYGWDANLNGDETYAVQMYELEDGTHAMHEIFWSQVSKTDRFDVEVFGRKGGIYIRNPFTKENLLVGTTKEGIEKDSSWEYPDYEETFFGAWHHQLFIDDVRYGTHNSLSAEDGFKAIAVIEAARRSMVSGKWEETLQPK